MSSTTWPSAYFISETKRSSFADLAADLQLDRRALLGAPVSATAEVEEDVPEDGVLAAFDSYVTVTTCFSFPRPPNSSKRRVGPTCRT
ncbi:hypothetical protein OG892_39680 [Streptomyces sp. NBC_00341]|uniref:hypothetical protein n=1 Tax=Streptomyces sp. NBC_00341 TaxID=2975717 RepID=UPI00308DFCA3|nr:hypothetical protein OG892_39680 [Streptomyces sp. NBC_00341]